MPDYTKDLIAASSFPIILSILYQEESYGYEIIRQIKEASNNQLQFAEGTLYPILKKMEQLKWITAKWKVGENGRERKYYKITSLGKKQLSIEKNNWQSLTQILEKIWNKSLILNMQ